MPRSLKVAPENLDQVKLALQRQGFARQQDLAERLMLSRDTVNKFLNGRSIDYLNFVEICRILELDWQDIIERQENSMPDQKLSEVYNRDVFILIDQSGSMCKQDAADSDLSRWDSLKEVVMSHVDRVLKQKISDSVSIYLFSRNTFKAENFKVKNASQVEDIFIENHPDQATFIVPTLRHCINEVWFKNRYQSTTQGAFFVIYTDGQFNDIDDFEALIKQTCEKIDDQRMIKIFIIGVGSEIKNLINRKHFENLNRNSKENVDKNGEPCDIVGFALADEMGDIIEVLEDELRANF